MFIKNRIFFLFSKCLLRDKAAPAPSLPPTFTLLEKLIFSLFCALGVLSKNRAVVPRVWKMESVDQQLLTQLEGTNEFWHSALQYSHIVNDNARPRVTGVFWVHSAWRRDGRPRWYVCELHALLVLQYIHESKYYPVPNKYEQILCL